MTTRPTVSNRSVWSVSGEGACGSDLSWTFTRKRLDLHQGESDFSQTYHTRPNQADVSQTASLTFCTDFVTRSKIRVWRPSDLQQAKPNLVGLLLTSSKPRSENIRCVAERSGLEFSTSLNAHWMRLIHSNILAEIQWHLARFNGSSIEFCGRFNGYWMFHFSQNDKTRQSIQGVSNAFQSYLMELSNIQCFWEIWGTLKHNSMWH
jgi:hypothetical protein